MDGFPVGLGVEKTKRGRAGGLKSMSGTTSRSSSSIVGYGGVVGGGDGEGESEMEIASGGFGRRRFVAGCVGRSDVDASFPSPSVSSSSDPASSISSRVLFGIGPGNRSRLERGEANCGATAVFSVAGFGVELKLNLGAEVNC